MIGVIMEEIDIIELLQRVKEGNAPKEIEINNRIFKYNNSIKSIELLYTNCDNEWLRYYTTCDTKIKILDKHIIEELHETYDVSKLADMQKFIRDIGNKTNEIIKWINNKEE